MCFWVFFVILLRHRCLGCTDDEISALLEIKASVRYFYADARDYCSWISSQCSSTTGCVSKLVLSNLSFYDPLLNVSLFLPFKDLQHLDFSSNEIIGTKGDQGIEKLVKLKKLQILNLSGNRFNTNVLEPLSQLTSLRTLNLDQNHLGHSSSLEISQGILKLSNLKKLEVLSLSYNNLSTTILAPLGKITSLKNLYLGHNHIGEGSTSEISQGFDKLLKLKRLQFLDLQDNILNHTDILVSLSKLMSLQNLNLRQNQLRTGSSIEIYPGFCELKKLQEIDLSHNNLKGEIPPCLVNFTSLTTLDLSNNQLRSLDFSNTQFIETTRINSSLEQKFQLKYLYLSNCNLNTSTTSLLKFLHGQSELQFIDLSHNNIHGKFPLWLVANNSKLEAIVLNNNSLSGDIYFPLHLRTNLEWIDLSKNHIEGHLQTNLGQVLQGVQYLNLSQNHLEGSIPTSLGDMQELLDLDLSNNNFTGQIPGSLQRGKLISLVLSNNMLHGEISFALMRCSILCLDNNQFTGVVPNRSIDVILDSHTLDLSKNNISGRIPSWIANLTYVRTLLMGDNFFHGSIPLELCNLAYLRFLDLSQNELSGNIPSCLNLSSLNYMHLQGNKLSGSLPPAILRSPYLVTLDLNYNNFSGSIPDWVGLLEDLSVLLLKGNRLSGFVPYELCQSKKIWILDLSHNGFSGKIPPCLSNITFGKSGGFAHYSQAMFSILKYSRFLPGPYVSQEEVEFMTKGLSSSYKGHILNYMSGMDLSCNNFSGHIPHEFGALTEIRALNLSYNQLTGPIPKTLSKLKQLESMDLSHNKLNGEIPSDLTELNFLGTFVVAYNNLSGRLPNMNQQAETSYEGNPYLCGPPLLKQCNGASAPTGSVTTTDAALSDVFGVDPISFLASCAAAYAMALLTLVVVLYINPYWRRLWFDSIDACLSFMFPFWAEAFYRVSNPFT